MMTDELGQVLKLQILLLIFFFFLIFASSFCAPGSLYGDLYMQILTELILNNQHLVERNHFSDTRLVWYSGTYM